MIKLKKLVTEGNDKDDKIKQFISVLSKYGLEYHSPMDSKDAFSWRGSIYPTITDKDKSVKVALDRTDVFGRNGSVWVGDSSRPIVNGYVIQAIVTDPKFRKQGKANQILTNVIKAADEIGINLKLEPVPMKDFIKKGDEKLSQSQLIKWYAKHGFKKEPNANIMIRQPKSKINELEYPLATGENQQASCGNGKLEG